MPSNVARGSYYQSKTRKWLEAQGYVVEPLQLMAWIKTTGGWRPLKRDSFGADLLAVSPERTLFVQVKSGNTWRSNLAAARAAFFQYPLGPGCEQIIYGWNPRAPNPVAILVRRGPCAPEVWTEPKAPRRRPKELPLFAPKAPRSRAGAARTASERRTATGQGQTP